MRIALASGSFQAIFCHRRRESTALSGSSWLGISASLEAILPEVRISLPNACLRRAFGRQADFVIGGYVDPRDEGPFGDHTGY
jgi:hypothetical protein